jgi:hypothetical protein
VAVEECEAVTVSRLQVEAPDRVWTMPSSFAPVEVSLGDVVGLVGVRGVPESAVPGREIDLQLAWTALMEMEHAYRVYVHLLDENGDLLDQNDGEPVGWTRPTPGWAPGEVVVDPRPLNVPEGAPSGRYLIRVGLYDPDSGLRLTTPEGEDGVVVGTVVVE